jgi:hypothetical protein
MKSLSGFVICLLGVIPALPAAEEAATNLPPAAVDLWKASGGDNWSKVKEIDFNFVVEGMASNSSARPTSGMWPRERTT